MAIRKQINRTNESLVSLMECGGTLVRTLTEVVF